MRPAGIPQCVWCIRELRIPSVSNQMQTVNYQRPRNTLAWFAHSFRREKITLTWFIPIVLKSFILNALSLISIYTFDIVLLPLVRGQQKWIHRNVGWVYKVLWLIPLAAASVYLNVGAPHHLSSSI